MATLGSSAGVLGAAAGALTARGRDDVVESWRTSPASELPSAPPYGAGGVRRST